MKCCFIFILIFFYCVNTMAQSADYRQSAGLTIGIPMINRVHFYDYRDEENKNQTGAFGIGFSLFYKKAKNKFSLGFESPLFQSFIPPKGGYSSISCNLFEGIFHHKISKQIALLAGLNYAVYQYHSYVDIPRIPDIDKKDAFIGLTTGAEFIATKTTSFLLIYRPSLISFDNKRYRHNISLDCRFNINFWKRKEKN